jgi:hypothetical protein
MAFVSNAFLNEPSNITLRSYQHAARVFTDDQFRLAPKFGFNFHVSFVLNRSALQNTDLVERYKNEINMMVKSVDLPKFTIKQDTLNQYNRKKNIQTTHTYNPVTITFHDDNMSLITNLWQNYYSYYFADPVSATAPGAFNRTATRKFDFINSNYGLDNGSTLPFFESITIYQMARHEWVSYTLYNPLITEFTHPKVKYAESAVTEHQMTIAYEAVSYDYGEVGTPDAEATASNPVGFGKDHYDQVPSPLVGVQDNGKITPSLLSTNSISANAGSFLNNLVQTINGYQNTGSNFGTSTIGGILTTPASTQTVGGLQGFSFPTSTATNTTTVTASPIGTINTGR